MERTEKKHGRRKRLIVSAAAVVTAVIVSIAFWPGPKEPEYEGRKLSEWLEICRYDRLPKYGNPADADLHGSERKGFNRRKRR